ncbi:hypothetical protein [Bacillus thuringiensis]|uniref:HEXXH motif domain-containing protein n=1 Tax=Bacillus thuringiensis subsp. higo TaxID=132266 RepID=A0A9X6M4E4_BACUH|nr:hypothetical protein [Bacillus thuringiensis]OUB58709.1 hypothetical protein BK716_04850 [Bacillus thuringiensis serovar higo]
MKELLHIEKRLTTGPYGDGVALNYNFNQFINGMAEILSSTSNHKLNDMLETSNNLGRVALSGTCMMSAILCEKDSSHSTISNLIEQTINGINKKAYEEITLKTNQPLALINSNSSVKEQESVLGIIKKRFEENMGESGVPLVLQLSPVTINEQNNIEESIKLLSYYLPHLTDDVLSMIAAILPIGNPVESAFISPTPLLIYINPQMFSNRLDLADAILHESLHHKLLTIRLTKRLLRPGYDDFTGLSVPIPWGATKYRVFSIGRTIAAAHVYIHLTLLHIKALLQQNETQGIPSDIEIKKRLIIRYQRANYLIETLSMRHYRHEFGADGLEFIEWMREIFHEISDLKVMQEILEENKALSHI